MTLFSKLILAKLEKKLGLAIINMNSAAANKGISHVNKRFRDIIEYIIDLFASGYHIVAIQEGRNCDDAPPIREILALLPSNIAFEITPYEEVEIKYSNFLITLYNTETIEHLGTTKTVFEEHVKKDRSYLESRFRLKGTGYEFTIVNTHFSMNEKEKDAAVKQLIDAFSTKKRVIIMGDFNLFMDLNGPEQLEKLKNAFSKRIGDNIVLEDGTVLNGSFIGFPYDKMRKYSHENLSPLINAFLTSGIKLNDDVIVPGVTNEILEKMFEWNSGKDMEKCPFFTDHLPLTFEVEFCD